MNNAEYLIQTNKSVLKVNKEIYPTVVLMKAAYIFIDEFYIFFDIDSKEKNIIIITFTSKEDMEEKKIEKKIGEFINELLHQSIRLSLSAKTEDLRKIILSRAIYGTTFDLNNFQDTKVISNDDCIDDEKTIDDEMIGIDWFKKY